MVESDLVGSLPHWVASCPLSCQVGADELVVGFRYGIGLVLGHLDAVVVRLDGTDQRHLVGDHVWARGVGGDPWDLPCLVVACRRMAVVLGCSLDGLVVAELVCRPG